MDMSPAYQSGASQFFPQAQIVFDRFHLMQMAGQALDKVRKELTREGADLKGALWALRGNEWTRSQEQCQQRSALCNRYPKLGRAIGLRDMFRTSSPTKIRRPCAGGVSAPSSVGSNPPVSWRGASKNIGAVSSPFSILGLPTAPSKRLTACSSLLSAWPEVSVPCVISASWPISKPPVFISIYHPLKPSPVTHSE
jgi:hypothetical protein